MEETMYIIKPEAMISYRTIRKLIQGVGLVIGQTKNLVMTEWALKKMYPDLSKDLWNATCLSFTAPVEIGLVTGENAVKVLFNFVGTETAPSECDHLSLRFKFGKRDPFIIGTMKYYANAIHRPKNRREAKRDVRLFHQL